MDQQRCTKAWTVAIALTVGVSWGVYASWLSGTATAIATETIPTIERRYATQQLRTEREIYLALHPEVVAHGESR
jgi:hypothetical protein